MSARRQMGLSNVTSYSSVTGNESVARRLLGTYGPLSHNNVDLWVGGLASLFTLT